MLIAPPLGKRYVWKPGIDPENLPNDGLEIDVHLRLVDDPIPQYPRTAAAKRYSLPSVDRVLDFLGSGMLHVDYLPWSKSPQEVFSALGMRTEGALYDFDGSILKTDDEPMPNWDEIQSRVAGVVHDMTTRFPNLDLNGISVTPYRPRCMGWGAQGIAILPKARGVVFNPAFLLTSSADVGSRTPFSVMDTFNIDAQQHAIRHEIGHTLTYKQLPISAGGEMFESLWWAATSALGISDAWWKKVASYGSYHHTEAMAECFALFTSPRYTRIANSTKGRNRALTGTTHLVTLRPTESNKSVVLHEGDVLDLRGYTGLTRSACLEFLYEGREVEVLTEFIIDQIEYTLRRMGFDLGSWDSNLHVEAKTTTQFLPRPLEVVLESMIAASGDISRSYEQVV